MLEIVERFISISGEAPIIGKPTYFYRFTGCNLNCSYCDTLYKNEVNLKLSVDEIVDDIKSKVQEYPVLKVLFTGGEPLLSDRQDQLIMIMSKLPKIEFYIETNGSVEIMSNNLNNCHYVCDYKAPVSGEVNSFNEENLKKLNGKNDCLKFVIAQDDLNWFKEKVLEIGRINNSLSVYVSPVYGKLKLDVLAEFVLKNKLPVNLSIQLHKIIWEKVDRGV